MLVGYSFDPKGYKSFNPSTQMVPVSRDVVFDKSTCWYEPVLAQFGLNEEELDITSDDNIGLGL